MRPLKEAEVRAVCLVSLAVGAMFGDALIHLLPEAFQKSGNTLMPSMSVLGVILGFFVLEQIVKKNWSRRNPLCRYVQWLADWTDANPERVGIRKRFALRSNPEVRRRVISIQQPPHQPTLDYLVTG